MTTDEAGAASAGITSVPEPESTRTFGSAVRGLLRSRHLASAGVLAATLAIVAGIELIEVPREPARTEAAGDGLPSALGDRDLAADLDDHSGTSRAALEAREARRLEELEAALGALASEGAEARLEARSHRTSSGELLAAHATRLDEAEGSIQALSDTHGAFVERLDAFVRRVETLAADVGSLRSNRKKSPVTRRPRPRAKPPFSVEAIDQWDGVAYAVVSQGGKPDFLRVGQIRSGWRLAAIDTTARTVELVDARGRAHVYRLEGR